MTAQIEQQVVFIDSRVPDIQDLLDGLQPGERAFVIDPSSDGIEQIADILAANNLTNLSAISIVSHGASGEVALGSATLTDGNLATHSSALAEIGASLAPAGAIQLFGCDVAQGVAGQQFINDFSTFAGGVQVDAATHIVGSASLGGSWTLDAVSDSGTSGATPAPTGGAASLDAPASIVAPAAATVTAPFTQSALANFPGTLVAPVPLTTEIWFVTAGAAASTNSLDDAEDPLSDETVSNQHTLFAAGSTHAFVHLSDVALDTQDGTFFAIDSGGNGDPNVILKGSLSTALAGNDGPGTGAFTTIYNLALSGAQEGGIEAMKVDVPDQLIYFIQADPDETNVELDRIGFNGGAVTTLAKIPNVFFEDMALDLTTGNAYITAISSYAGFGGVTVGANQIYDISGISAGSGTATATPLTLGSGVNFPTSLGVLAGVAVDTQHQVLYFTTDATKTNSNGGIFFYDLQGNPSHTFGTLFLEPAGTGGLNSTSGTPFSALGDIEVDPTTGLYYVSDSGKESVVGVSDNSIYVGGLVGGSLSTTPTHFLSDAAGAAIEGMSLDNAPTLTITPTNPTFTESVNNPALTNNTPVALMSADTASDSDNTKLVSATVSISSGFFAGDVLTFTPNHSITGSYNSSSGVLTLSGEDSFIDYQNALASVTFTSTSENPTDFGADASRTLSLTVNDGLLDSTAQTETVAVVGTNDAPVNHLPVSLTGNEDHSLALTGMSVTDVDANPATQNIIVAISVLHGTLTVATNVAGGLVAANVVGNNSGTVTLTGTQNAIDATLAANGLVYLGNANYNGPDTVTVTTNDQGATGAGGAQQTQNSFGLTINPVDDAPAGNDNSKTILEDHSYTFASADFGFTDPIDAANGAHGADSLLAVKVSTLASAGTLTDNGVAVTAGQAVSVADITGGKLVFAPAANANGTNYASFTFQVQDNGGTANGGVDTDASPNTFAFNVTPVNDPPAGTDKTVTINEDSNYTFAAADFGFGDPNDTPANNLKAVEITTLPAGGTLTDNGVAVTAGQFVAVADIAANKLVFTPTANANGAPETTFTFQVQDDGGTANGGIDTDPTPNTITVDVNSVNDAPAGANKTITTNEDTAYTFAAGDFGFSDANDTPANNFVQVEITTLPGAGTLTDNGSAVTAGNFVLVSDINAGKLVFTPAANASGTNYANLTFQVQDDGGTANGGVNTDPTPNTITFNVNAVNDAPAGTNNTATINEDTAFTFATADFGFSDPNDTPANNLLAVEITTTPGAGTLTDNGVAVTAGQFVSVADIAGGHLVFAPAAEANGTNYANFTFQVQDDGGTANGGVDTDPSANTFTFNVTSVNDAPAGTDNTQTILEDHSFTFAAADFGFSDPNDTPANNLLAVEITTTPGAGSLTDNGTAVTAGQFVSAADITGGHLVFTPAANANGTNYANFTFQVQDDGGTANGGVDTDPSANTFTFNVTSVNDAPAGTDATLSVDATLGDFTFTAGDFGFTDPNDSPANNFVAVKIDTLPTHGSLTDGGVAVTAGQLITVADVNAGNLKFTADPAHAGLDSGLTFQVEDDGGTANGGVDTDPTPNTLTLNVKIANQAPVGTDESIADHQDSPYTFVAGDFGFTDPLDTPPNHLLAVEITTLPSDGTLTDNGIAVAPAQFVSATDINNGLLVYTPNSPDPAGNGFDTFTFQVEDDGGTANGGVDTDPAAKTLTVDIVGVNHAPAGTDATQTILEDHAYTFATGDFGFTDPNDTPADHLAAVEITTLPGGGTLTDNGIAVTAGAFVSATDITANKLVFAPTPNANGTPETSFTFQVEDDGGTANGGIDTDPSANTFTFDVTSVNDAPAGTSNTVVTNEDTPYVFGAADFGFTDGNDSPANALLAVEITTLPGAGSGSLTDNGVAVTAGQFVQVADITGGKLVFTPAANANGAPEASFTFQVQDDGGTLNGGLDTDPTPKTMAVDVTSVNDAPSGANITQTTLEDTPYVFASADFGFTDPNDSPANTLLAVEITTLPTGGTITDNGVAVTAGQFIPVADITGGLLVFTPPADANGAPETSFTFQVQDNGGTANGGTDTDPTPKTFTFNVTSVNDAPSGTSNTVTTNEDTPYVFGAADFGFTDGHDSPANHLNAVEITTLPGAGTGSLTDHGVAVTAGQFVSAADITGGQLVFTPAANASGAPDASFTFQVQDDGGTANGGTDTDPTPKTMTVDVNSVNDAPSGANITQTTLEDTPYIFASADFGFSDANDAPPNTFQAVEITTLPGAGGTLTDNGVAVTAGQFIPVADITGGLLAFTPTPNANGAPEASFTFQVQDNGGTLNGGVDTDPAPKTFKFDVTSVNDAPSGTNNTVTTKEDTPFAFAVADFGFADPNDTPPNNLLAVEITTLPGAGTLTDNGVAVTAGQFVFATDIAAGQLVFAPAPNANGTNYASFTFQVQDNGGTANGGVDTDPTAKTLTVNVTPVNDPPVLADVAPNAVYAPGSPPVDLSPGSLVPPLTITDVDNTTLAGATVTITNGTFLGDELAVNGQSNGVVPGLPNITAVYNPGNFTLTLTGTDTLADYALALEEVTFASTNGSPTNGGLDATRTLAWVLNDGSASNNLSTPVQTTISLHTLDLDGNDSTAPGTSFAGTFTEHGGPVAVADADVVINDADTATMTSATVTLTNAQAADSLAVSGILPGGITSTIDTSVPGLITLTLSGSASTADYQAALHQVVFNNTSGNPAGGPRDIDISVTDSLGDTTNTAQSVITVVPVNDPPTLSGASDASFTENGAAVALSPTTMSVTDPDSPAVVDATVHLGGGFANDGDQLAFSTAGTLISANYDSIAETLTLTGTDSFADYAQVLNSITFVTPSDNPTNFGANPDRIVTWTLDDGAATNPTSTVTTTVSITAVNDPPQLSSVVASERLPISHTLVVSPNLTVTDPDNQDLASATVAVTAGGFAGDGDQLTATTAGTNITGVYDPLTETLTLTGSDTLANYTSVLDSVTLATGPNAGGAAHNRTITWTVDDGSGLNNTATATTTVQVASPKNDFNGDSISDVSFQDAGSGLPLIDFVNNATVTSSATLPNPSTAWNIVGSGDFNGDGHADVLWQNTDGTPAVWLMNGASIISAAALPNPGTFWHEIGTGDFDGDGKSDILFQGADGTPAIWLMNGTSLTAGVGLPNPGTFWHLVGTGDFNGDGKSDLVFQGADGTPAVWLMNGTSLIAGVGLPNPGTAWHLVGTGDFNGDGSADLVFQNTDGTPAIWLMNGTSLATGVALPNPGSAMHLVGTGDFNGDGKADLLFQNTSTGTPVVWTMNGTTVTAQNTLPNPGNVNFHANTG